MPGTWPGFILAEAWATRMGFGIHSIYLGHQGSICDVRNDPIGCGQAWFLRLVLLPLLFRWLEGRMWRAWERSTASTPSDEHEQSSRDSSPITTPRHAVLDATPEQTKVKKRAAPGGAPPDFKL